MILLVLGYAAQASGETVVAAGTIRSQTVIRPSDVALIEDVTPGALAAVEDAIGLEARVNLYPGRPISATDLRAPAIIMRNEIITLRYQRGTLRIVTEGRALDRAGLGDRLRVINLASRNTVTGIVVAPGVATVGGLQ